MKTSNFKKLIGALVLIPMAGSLMGNKGCEKQPEVAKRELRRRVQLGQFQAPPITSSDGSQFDFGYAARAQLYSALSKTQSFSTSTIPSGFLDLASATEKDKQAFYTCEDTSNANVSGKMRVQSKGDFSKDAACMIDMPLGKVTGSIISFELQNAVGASLNLFKPIDVGVNFKMAKSVLTMVLNADSPFIRNHNIASTREQTYQKQNSVGANIGFNNIGIGGSFYWQTPLADVVNDGLMNGLTHLRDAWNQAEPWYAMVLKNCDEVMVINAGSASDAGLKVGDILEVRNVWYDWEGEKCNSTLRGTVMSSTIIAQVKVVTVGDTMSVVEVIKGTETGEKIIPGARAYLKQMVEDQVASNSGASKP